MKLGFASSSDPSEANAGARGRSALSLPDWLRPRQTDAPRTPGPATADPDGTGGATFRLIDPQCLVNALVAVFAADTPEARRMKSQVEAEGATVMLVSQAELPAAWLRAYAPLLTCCVVGHDFADFAAAADFCLQLRLIAPDLPIVLAMPGAAPHDFGPSLLPVCDVRLRRPVSRMPLLLGIQSACVNRAVRSPADLASHVTEPVPRLSTDNWGVATHIRH